MKNNSQIYRRKKWKHRHNYGYQNDIEFLVLVTEYIPNDYVRKRLKNLLDWYMITYHLYERRYNVVSMITLILPAVIILLNDIQDYANYENVCEMGIAITSAIVTVVSGLNGYYHWHEQAVEYRSYVELIKYETMCYIAGIYEYADIENKDKIFINRIETLSLKENTVWRTEQERKKCK